MVSSNQRRIASTENIQHFWDAISYIRQQKQIPSVERIANYMRRKHNISANELERQLDFAVKDKLIALKKRVGCKGSKVGIEQEAYRLPDDNINKKDGHDWYCFQCHKEGDVILCTTCHRVYHESCVKETLADGEKFVCDVCKLLKTKDTLKIKKDDLNLLLSYTCLRLKEKVGSRRELLKMPLNDHEMWRYNWLIYEQIDLSAMDEKAQDNVYKRIEEFQIDAQTLVHNVVIYYGVLSPVADMARQMLRDCCYDLNEIKQCKDCYRMSNDKRDKHWFCQPCDPPHELVFAKQKGFPYWPAKIIRIENGMYDVRFFGGHHQRANIEKEYIKPITTSLQQLQLKRTTALGKALDELKRHQSILQHPPIKDTPTKSNKKNQRSRPVSSSSSRSGSESRSRSRKGSPSSEDEEVSENEATNDSQDECPTSSSPKPKVPRFKDAPTPEDHNVVSSSSQESPNPKVTVSTQTHKKLLAPLLPPKPDKVEEKPPSCDCKTKYEKMFAEFKETMEKKFQEDKEQSLQELAEKLTKDFDEEKKALIKTAIEKIRGEYEEEKKTFEEQLKQAHQLELADLDKNHRAFVSEVKKKQWCYNCKKSAERRCCGITFYCSEACQYIDFYKGHEKICLNK